MKLSILTTMAAQPWGGSEELWVKLAKRLHEKGHAISVSVYDWGKLPYQIKELKDTGILLQKRKRIAYNSLSKKFLAKIRQYTIAEKQLHIFTKNTKPDILIISMGSFADLEITPLRKFLLKTKTPYILIVHVNPESHKISNSKIKEVKAVSKKAESVWFVSKRLRQIAERQIAYDFPNSRIVVNPVNMNNTEFITYPGNNKTFRFAVVGRLSVDIKGQALLLQILAQDKWKKRNWELNIYGEGPDKSLINELIDLYNLNDKVFLKGFVNDIRKEIWQNNHLLLMPSYYEGLPIALVEAMLCGRPAVATDVGGNMEILNNDTGGYIAEGATFFSFDKALERAWNDRNNWQSIGRLAHINAKKYFGDDPIEKLIKLIENEN